MAVGLGFVLGSAALVGREFLDRSVHDARALRSEFAVPVLGPEPVVLPFEVSPEAEARAVFERADRALAGRPAIPARTATAPLLSRQWW